MGWAVADGREQEREPMLCACFHGEVVFVEPFLPPQPVPSDQVSAQSHLPTTV